MERRVIVASEALAENIKRLVDGLALEIERRYEADPDGGTVAHHAKLVLLDWFLGDFIPPR